jgi:hypothetical protein
VNASHMPSLLPVSNECPVIDGVLFGKGVGAEVEEEKPQEFIENSKDQEYPDVEEYKNKHH